MKAGGKLRFSWEKNASKSPSRTWQETYKRAKREQLLLRDAICILSLDFALDGGGLLNNAKLFLLILDQIVILSVAEASQSQTPQTGFSRFRRSF